MNQKEVQWHGREAERNHKPEKRCDKIQQQFIPFIAKAERLECGLKSMFQMIREKNKRYDIEGDVPRTLKGLPDNFVHRCAIGKET
jgi:hypothetical protein